MQRRNLFIWKVVIATTLNFNRLIKKDCENKALVQLWTRVLFIYFNMEVVENDFNIVKSKTFLTVTENNADEVYDSSLAITAEEFNYLVELPQST